MIVRYKKFHKNARVPEYARAGDSGADLFAVDSCWLKPGEPKVIKFGFALELPDGYEAQIRPRSSMSKQGIHVAFGTIDSGYRGEIGATVMVVNPGLGQYPIHIGDKVAQLVIAPVSRASFELAESLSESARGEGGWGSTGK